MIEGPAQGPKEKVRPRGGMVTLGPSRKLRAHVFNHKDKAERMKWKWGEAENPQSPVWYFL